MRRRALLLGCPGKGLYGVSRSIDRVRAVLTDKHSFTCDVYGEVDARAFTAALGGFCESTEVGDVIVLVYVGHGIFFESDEPGEDGDGTRSRYLQALAPTDMLTSTADCPAITGLDLARALAVLSAKAENVTLVLDCCHAAGMVAGLDPNDPISRAHDDRLRRELARVRGLTYRSEENKALCFVGSSTVGRAYEVIEVEDGVEKKIGAFSKALAEALADAREDATWWGLEADAQRRLFEISDRTQWIAVEGPRERVIFTCHPAPLPSESAACVWQPERSGQAEARRPGLSGLIVKAGAVHGVQRGDRFAVFDSARGGKLVGTARVVALAATEAELAPFPSALGEALSAGAHAMCVRYKTRYGLSIAPDVEELGVLEPSLPGWRMSCSGFRASIRALDDRIELIESGQKYAIVSRPRDDPRAREALRRGLTRIGAWLRIREIVLKNQWRPPTGAFELTRLRPSGSSEPLFSVRELVAGETLRVQVRHDGSLWSRLHCAAFRVSGDRTIHRLTADAAHGVPLFKHEPHVFGRSELDPERGWDVTWPELSPDAAPLDEYLLFFVSTTELALYDLATAAEAMPPPVRGPGDAIRCCVVPYRLRPAQAREAGEREPDPTDRVGHPSA